jgi:hypothetical protein
LEISQFPRQRLRALANHQTGHVERTTRDAILRVVLCRAGVSSLYPKASPPVLFVDGIFCWQSSLSKPAPGQGVVGTLQGGAQRMFLEQPSQVARPALALTKSRRWGQRRETTVDIACCNSSPAWHWPFQRQRIQFFGIGRRKAVLRCKHGSRCILIDWLRGFFQRSARDQSWSSQESGMPTLHLLKRGGKGSILVGCWW